jgi:hypothetical protein
MRIRRMGMGGCGRCIFDGINCVWFSMDMNLNLTLFCTNLGGGVFKIINTRIAVHTLSDDVSPRG